MFSVELILPVAAFLASEEQSLVAVYVDRVRRVPMSSGPRRGSESSDLVSKAA
jgi:hypothetical protein